MSEVSGKGLIIRLYFTPSKTVPPACSLFSLAGPHPELHSALQNYMFMWRR